MAETQLQNLRIMDIEYRNRPTLLLRAYNNTKTCIIVVDMVDGFCKEGALANPLAAKIIEPIATTLDYLNNAHKIFVNDEHTEESSEFKTFPPHCHTKKERVIVTELNKYAKNVITKNSTNALFSLQKHINFGDFDNYIIVGCCTDICILQLSVSLKAIINEMNLSGNVLVFTDYVATYDASGHPADLCSIFAFKNMETAGVKIFKKLV